MLCRKLILFSYFHVAKIYCIKFFSRNQLFWKSKKTLQISIVFIQQKKYRRKLIILPIKLKDIHSPKTLGNLMLSLKEEIHLKGIKNYFNHKFSWCYLAELLFRFCFVGCNVSINSCQSLKILGVNFSSNLLWSDHVTKTIKKCNSLGYTLKYLDSLLWRKHYKHIIKSHFCCVLYYGPPIGAGCLSSKNLSRLNSLMFKIIRMHCRDFSCIFNNKELCKTCRIRFFNSVRILRDTNTLHSLCMNLTNTFTG